MREGEGGVMGKGCTQNSICPTKSEFESICSATIALALALALGLGLGSQTQTHTQTNIHTQTHSHLHLHSCSPVLNQSMAMYVSKLSAIAFMTLSQGTMSIEADRSALCNEFMSIMDACATEIEKG